MKKIFMLCGVLGALAACDKDAAEPVLTCGDYEVSVDFDKSVVDNLHVVINSDAVELGLVESASGAKYQGVLNDTTVVLWQKGEDWTLMLDEDIIIECASK